MPAGALTLRNLPTSSRMSLKTNTFLSPSNQPCFVIRAINWSWGGGGGGREREGREVREVVRRRREGRQDRRGAGEQGRRGEERREVRPERGGEEERRGAAREFTQRF